ncbi:universal stress protein [Streptomyces luteireticuli]|uniref:Universal stress protein n=1 Tax=Streptomyces luteireticuli TaxID=173858 RepID=A0ABN0YZT2_9ACTN
MFSNETAPNETALTEPALTEPAPTETARHGRVLVGFDGSEPALHALDRAVDDAVRRGEAELEILCGRPWGRNPVPGAAYTAARAALDRAVARVTARAPGLSVTPTLTAEPAAPALVRAGRAAALTVTGTRGRGGFAGLLLGSVAQRVAAHSRGPLLVVRDVPRRERGVVLVGLRSDADMEALRFGFEEAARRTADLWVVHARQHPDSPWDDVRLPTEPAEAVPERAAAALRAVYPDVEVGTAAVRPEAGTALTEASRQADVVVLAAHRRQCPFGLQLGPVTHALLRHAHCPVALVPVP